MAAEQGDSRCHGNGEKGGMGRIGGNGGFVNWGRIQIYRGAAAGGAPAAATSRPHSSPVGLYLPRTFASSALWRYRRERRVRFRVFALWPARPQPKPLILSLLILDIVLILVRRQGRGLRTVHLTTTSGCGRMKTLQGSKGPASIAEAKVDRPDQTPASCLNSLGRSSPGDQIIAPPRRITRFFPK